MAMNPAHFVEVMASWREFFARGAELPVIGATEDQLRSIPVPSCIVPGNDDVHPFAVGENLYSLLADSELHDIRGDVPAVAPGDLGPVELAELQVRRQEEIGEVFVDFLRRTVTPTAAAR